MGHFICGGTILLNTTNILGLHFQIIFALLTENKNTFESSAALAGNKPRTTPVSGRLGSQTMKPAKQPAKTSAPLSKTTRPLSKSTSKMRPGYGLAQTKLTLVKAVSSGMCFYVVYIFTCPQNFHLDHTFHCFC